MSKNLLAAGIVRDLAFLNHHALDLYLYRLDHNEVVYQILERWNRPDGSVVIRIVQQYNSSPLIQLYEEDF